jgi:hypothetical protein
LKKKHQNVPQSKQISTVPYFAAPVGSDPLQKLAEYTLTPPEGKLHWLKRHLPQLLWPTLTFLSTSLAYLIPLSLGLFKVSAFIAFLPVSGIMMLTGIAYGVTKKESEDAIEYNTAQEAAKAELKMPKQKTDHFIEDFLKKKFKESEKFIWEYIAENENEALSKSDETVFAPFNPVKSIDDIAEMMSNILKSNPHHFYIFLLMMQRLLVIEKNDDGEDACHHLYTPLAAYRFYAAIRILAQTNNEFTKFLDKLEDRKTVFPFIDQILQHTKTPYLDTLQKAAHPECFDLEGDDLLFAQERLAPKSLPLFSKEWFIAHRKPLTIALGVIAVAAIIAVVLMPILAMPLGYIGVTLAPISTPVAGMGGFTIGTLMVTLASALSPFAFFGAKKYYEKEREPLEIKLAQTREVELIKQETIENTCHKPSMFNSWSMPSAPKLPDFISHKIGLTK